MQAMAVEQPNAVNVWRDLVVELASLLAICAVARFAIWASSPEGERREEQAGEVQGATRGRSMSEDMENTVDMWRTRQLASSCDTATLLVAVRALAMVSPRTLVMELAPALRRDLSAVALVVEELFNAGHPKLAEDVHQAMCSQLIGHRRVRAYEALLNGNASIGNEARVADLIRELEAGSQAVSGRAHVLIIQGLLTCGRLEGALRQAQVAQQSGISLPSSTINALLGAAFDADRTTKTFELITTAGLPFYPDMLTMLLDDCTKCLVTPSKRSMRPDKCPTPPTRCPSTPANSLASSQADEESSDDDL